MRPIATINTALFVYRSCSFQKKMGKEGNQWIVCRCRVHNIFLNNEERSRVKFQVIGVAFIDYVGSITIY